MTGDFFERLTDPGRDGPDPHPSDADEMALAERLEPVLAMLRDAVPDNGIDLVPQWRARLADGRNGGIVETKVGLRATFWQRTTAPTWVAYAAVLVVGVLLGSWGLVMAGHRGAGAAMGNAGSHYTPEQGGWMMAALQARGDNADLDRDGARHALAGCVACHQVALRDLAVSTCRTGQTRSCAACHE